MMAAGSAMAMFALNLSDMLQPCERVAAMVVSEIKERLSPKNAPPSTTATKNGMLCPAVSATWTASGTKATTVPTDVPMDSDMKQAAKKSTGTTSDGGQARRARLTVASTAPISFAILANAPARINTHIM